MNNNEKLIEAAATGQTEIVRQLLGLGADIHADGDAALRSACLAGHFETVKLLLGEGADGRARDKDSPSDAPLHIAASGGHTRIVELLLEKPSVALNSWNREGPAAALRNASRGGHCETVTLLLSKGAFVYPPHEHGLGCVLCAAAENGHNSILEILISSSIEVADYLSPAMIWAARSGQTATVDFLLGKSADLINTPDEWDLPGAPLREAVANGHADTVKLLLERKVNFRAADGYGPESALRIAASAGEQEIIALLMCKYQTPELGKMLSDTMEPQLMNVIQKEYKKRMGKVVGDAVRSEPGLEI